MRVTLAALGGGTPEALTSECAAALREAEYILGARRLLDHLPRGCTQNRIAAVRPEELLAAILERGGNCAVVYSGDTGF